MDEVVQTLEWAIGRETKAGDVAEPDGETATKAKKAEASDPDQTW
ncbi:hypothetical protein [Oricola thermophila]|nr:hypothetical protein [Oricola thermophila]